MRTPNGLKSRILISLVATSLCLGFAAAYAEGTLESSLTGAICDIKNPPVERKLVVDRPSMITVVSGVDDHNSTTFHVAKAVEEKLKNAGVKVQFLDLSKVPTRALGQDYYQNPLPKNFQPFNDMIMNTDGLLMITPGKNNQYPGLLKDFLDHLDVIKAFNDKPTAFIGISEDATGAQIPIEQLTNTFQYRSAKISGNPTFISGMSNPLSGSATFNDPEVDRTVSQNLTNFQKFVDVNRAKMVPVKPNEAPVLYSGERIVGAIPAEKPKITILAGSNREEARSLKIAQIAADNLSAKGALVSIVDLQKVTSTGLRKPSPPQYLQQMRDRVAQADGVLVVIPEYNGGIPGILRTFIEKMPIKPGAASGFIGISAGDRGSVNPVDQLATIMRGMGASNFGKKTYIPFLEKVMSEDEKSFKPTEKNELQDRFDKNMAGFVDFTNRLRASH